MNQSYLSKDILEKKLEIEKIRLWFKMADKTTTSLYCTNNPEFIPQLPIDSHRGPYVPELAVVWDLENSKWAAFKWEKVYKIE